jgi:DNA polymerase
MAADSLGLDFETYGTVDLMKVGSSRYSRHPDTEVLMGSFNLNMGEPIQWDAAQGEPMPRLLEEALVDPEVEKWAWNAPFEMQITQNCLKMPLIIPQWRDTMVMAYACSFPGKLEKVGPIIDLPEDQQKMAMGKRLITKFSKPKVSRKRALMGQLVRTYWYEDLEDWENYLTYNRGDVVTETAIRRRLNQFRPMPDHEWELWHLDQKINMAGIPINLDMVRNAIKIYDNVLRDSFTLMEELTGLKNPNSTQQILPWLQQQGYMFDDVQKAHIKTARSYFEVKPDHWEQDQWEEYCSNETLKEVLDLRSETARTSIKKYQALIERTDDDGNLRGAFQFAGAARTWRWAGRGWQGQNLPRPEKMFEKGIVTHAAHVEVLDYQRIKLVYGNLFDLLASCLRSTAQAPEGYTLVDRDLNAIENRVLGWIAQCPKILRVFKLNRDPYIDFATYLFGGTYDELWAEYQAGDSVKRTISKPGVLGCGYMLGAGDVKVNRQTGEIEGTGLLGYAWDMGIKQFTKEQSALSVEVFRREFEEVKEYWYGIERAAKKAITTGRAIKYGQGFGAVTFDMHGPFLRMRLPSGRCLHYCRPRIEPQKTPWGEVRDTITYEGLNDRKQWVRQPTHPGKLTENADQAIARDLLAHSMLLCDRRGLDLRIHVHDQAVALALEGNASNELEIMRECMETPPKWGPDMPLGSAGFITKVWMKD